MNIIKPIDVEILQNNVRNIKDINSSIVKINKLLHEESLKGYNDVEIRRSTLNLSVDKMNKLVKIYNDTRGYISHYDSIKSILYISYTIPK